MSTTGWVQVSLFLYYRTYDDGMVVMYRSGLVWAWYVFLLEPKDQDRGPLSVSVLSSGSMKEREDAMEAADKAVLKELEKEQTGGAR